MKKYVGKLQNILKNGSRRRNSFVHLTSTHVIKKIGTKHPLMIVFQKAVNEDVCQNSKKSHFGGMGGVSGLDSAILFLHQRTDFGINWIIGALLNSTCSSPMQRNDVENILP